VLIPSGTQQSEYGWSNLLPLPGLLQLKSTHAYLFALKQLRIYKIGINFSTISCICSIVKGRVNVTRSTLDKLKISFVYISYMKYSK
jgi:hypothetical protein